MLSVFFQILRKEAIEYLLKKFGPRIMLLNFSQRVPLCCPQKTLCEMPYYVHFIEEKCKILQLESDTPRKEMHAFLPP